FKKLFFLQFFPRAEHECLKREYHSIRQTNTKTSTEFMQRFLRLAGFLGAAAGTEEEHAKNFQWGLRRLPMLLATMKSSMRGMMMTLSEQTSGRRVVIGISRPLSRVVTGITVIITTVVDQTGEVVVTTTAVTTTTTLAVTTGIPDYKKNTTASTPGQADKKPVHRVMFLQSLRIMLLIPQ
nr:zinc finger, CCHC-type, retrotransposon Gag domain protein [Tanacetum cinerariifolium]